MATSVDPSPSVHPSQVLDGLVVGRLRARSAAREYAEAVALAFLASLLIRGFVVQAFKIPSGSMLPTLQIGDHILVNKLAYGLRLPVFGTPVFAATAPARGDVVVFEYPVDPRKDFIKRVIGVPGDVIEIRQKRVYINGELWDDSHAYFADGGGNASGSPRDRYGPATVPAGQVFVLGDNRDRSYDSRFWGYVGLDEVKGKAFLIYWSWDGHDRWARWERIGDSIK